MISIFILFVFIEVKLNILDIFSRFYIKIIYKVSIFTLLIIILILTLLSLLIVNNYNNIVFYSFSNNEFNRFRFSFI